MFLIKHIFAVIISFTLSFCCISSSLALNNDYSGITSDSKILKAIDFLEKINDNFAIKAILGENLSKHPVRIIFKDLSLMNLEYENYDALTCADSRSGTIYIIINEKHRNAPAEAIACLLSHEVIHQRPQSSIEEEVQGWTNEAASWIAIKKLYPDTANLDENSYPLVKRMNTLEKMYEDSQYTPRLIKAAVISNYGYRNLAMSSPGYEK